MMYILYLFILLSVCLSVRPSVSFSTLGKACPHTHTHTHTRARARKHTHTHTHESAYLGQGGTSDELSGGQGDHRPLVEEVEVIAAHELPEDAEPNGLGEPRCVAHVGADDGGALPMAREHEVQVRAEHLV